MPNEWILFIADSMRNMVDAGQLFTKRLYPVIHAGIWHKGPLKCPCQVVDRIPTGFGPPIQDGVHIDAERRRIADAKKTVIGGRRRRGERYPAHFGRTAPARRRWRIRWQSRWRSRTAVVDGGNMHGERIQKARTHGGVSGCLHSGHRLRFQLVNYG